MYQKTLKCSTTFSGVGVHSGQKITVTLRPAPQGHGIVFKRTDVVGQDPFIPATWCQVRDTNFCTTLANEAGVSISTVEHLMSVFAALEVANVLVEVSGAEVPIMDGSASPLYFLVQAAGIQTQRAPRSYVRIVKPLTYQGDRGGYITLAPSRSFSIEAIVDLQVRGLPLQRYKGRNFQTAFGQEIAAARTFGFYEDGVKMKALGLAQGASLDNTLVFQEGVPMNPEGMRYENECARHKVLDALGDLYLLGMPLLASVTSFNGGHFLNYNALKNLVQNPDHYVIESGASAATNAPFSGLETAAVLTPHCG